MKTITYINQARQETVVRSSTIPRVGDFVIMGDTNYCVESVTHNLNNDSIIIRIIYYE